MRISDSCVANNGPRDEIYSEGEEVIMLRENVIVAVFDALLFAGTGYA